MLQALTRCCPLSGNNLNIDPNEQRKTLDKQGKCIYRHFQVIQAILLKAKYLYFQRVGGGGGEDFYQTQLNIFLKSLIRVSQMQSIFVLC